MHASKRPRTGLVLVESDDAISAFEEMHRWRSIVDAGASWEDPDFPAAQISIDGKATPDAVPAPAPAPTPAPAPAPAPVPAPGGAAPRCKCGVFATRSTVQSNTANKGRPYFHCPSRTCGFFAWADGDPSQPSRPGSSRPKEPLSWQRFPGLPVVTDYGFRAADLRQGGVGDCWFLSALAVVAERHDLIARLFADTASNSAGCYGVRFFLDGAWTSVLIDDRLPVTAAPRRPDLAFAARLAFSRCGSEASGQLLWASLLEKAYAKAHGSYQAISGGQISEALLDLTGAPTLSVDFTERAFDSERLWARMRAWKRAELPMGCATDRDPELKEVGLCGGHAYSVLSVTEVRLRGSGRVERLVRVRNPHGVGEWNGDWSDRSAKWSELLAADGAAASDSWGSPSGGRLERTGADDGTFWIDWTHFLMGFSVVEVCLARRGWHCTSLPNAFPAKTSAWRVCSAIYRVAPPAEPTTLYLMALQPTKRGAWCRADRKKSYRPGDVSIFVARLGPAGEVQYRSR